MRRLTLGRMLKLAVALAAPAAIAGAAVAASTGAPAADPVAAVARPVPAADAEQLAAYGILRQQRGADDALADAAAQAVARGAGPELGANPQLSHRTTTALEGVEVYAVPAQGWMCLVDGDGLSSCNRTAEARKGYLVTLQGVREGYKLRGLLPDGIKEVTVVGDGTSATVPVQRNGWAAAVTFTPSAFRYVDAGGQHEIPVAPPVEEG